MAADSSTPWHVACLFAGRRSIQGLNFLDNYQPIHFYVDPIQAIFDTPPAREKSPDCPNGFIWNDQTYDVTEILSSWSDFARRGKMAKNMRPAHAAVAASRGS